MVLSAAPVRQPEPARRGRACADGPQGPVPIAGGYPPAMHEFVQHVEIEAHPDLVKHSLQPGVERLTVLAYHQGGPDAAQVPGRTKRPSEEVVRLRAHPGLLSWPPNLLS